MRELARPHGATVNPPRGRRPSRIDCAKLTTVSAGLGIGLTALGLGSLELKWPVYAIVGMILFGIVIVARDRIALLTGLFILGMQADVYLRPGYGRAGTAGLEIPLCVLAGALLYCLLAVGPRRGRMVYFGELRMPILAILATTVVATVFSEERFAGLARLLFELELLFVYVLGINIVLHDRGLKRVVRLFAITLGIQAFVFFVQSFSGQSFSLLGEVNDLGGIPRPGGTVSTNPAGFASYVMPLIMILAARFVSVQPNRPRSRVEGFLVVIGMTTIVMTYTRAAWAGLVLGLACITWMGVNRGFVTMKQVGAIAVVLVVVAIACMPMITARLNEAPLGDSYDERAALNRMAMLVIAAHPVSGIGPGSYEFAYKHYLTNELRDAWQFTVHNEYLLRTAETGIVGGCALVLLLVRAFGQSRRLSDFSDWETRTFGLGWTAGLLALCWQMYWVPWRGFTYNSVLWLLLGLTEGALLLRERAEEVPRNLIPSDITQPARH